MPNLGIGVPAGTALAWNRPNNGFGGNATPPPNDPTANQYRLYNSAVAQDATDRNSIMQGYRDLASRQITPQMANYQQSKESQGAISNLADLSRTGGYSDQNIQDMRARSISPIRSIYSNALREVDRGRRLAGGFSPNYNATRARMARDMSTQIGDLSQNVEGQLAEAQASGRRGIAGTYASAAADQSNLANQMGSQNADRANAANQFNLQFPLQAMQGMQSMYGTTPANSALFGSQALQHASLQNQMQNEVENNQLQAANIFSRGRFS